MGKAEHLPLLERATGGGEKELSMENRRGFMKKMVMGSVATSAFGDLSCSSAQSAPGRVLNKNPRKGLVLWYSQTGHTARIGRLIQHAWQRKGLKVDGSDYRSLDPSALENCDLIAIGTPVQYMDVPVNLKEWMTSLPSLGGASVAAFVTYGGPGDGQHNTACGLLEIMATKGGVPLGLDLFGHMSTFAPTWSLGNSERILAFKNRPNNDTYLQARKFAGRILENVNKGRAHVIVREFGMDTLMRAFPQIGLTKLFITDHHIHNASCVQCGTCVEKCPMDAIDLAKGQIDTERCIACLGCINNCPERAMRMKFAGTELYGYNEFLKKNQIVFPEPTLL